MQHQQSPPNGMMRRNSCQGNNAVEKQCNGTTGWLSRLIASCYTAERVYSGIRSRQDKACIEQGGTIQLSNSCIETVDSSRSAFTRAVSRVLAPWWVWQIFKVTPYFLSCIQNSSVVNAAIYYHLSIYFQCWVNTSQTIENCKIIMGWFCNISADFLIIKHTFGQHCWWDTSNRIHNNDNDTVKLHRSRLFARKIRFESIVLKTR